jgi:hypothetical protein
MFHLNDMMSAVLAGFDVANIESTKYGQDRPWKVLELKRDEFVVLHMPSGSKFRVKMKEEL